jgi:hypothetical protein
MKHTNQNRDCAFLLRDHALAVTEAAFLQSMSVLNDGELAATESVLFSSSTLRNQNLDMQSKYETQWVCPFSVLVNLKTPRVSCSRESCPGLGVRVSFLSDGELAVTGAAQFWSLPQNSELETRQEERVWRRGRW